MAPKHQPTNALGAPAPIRRAWHVLLATGSNEMFVAHDCTIESGGVLAFYNHTSNHQRVLIRAIRPTDWRDVELQDTPHSEAVHQLAWSGADARP